MARIIIRDTIPTFTRRPFFYMSDPAKSAEYAMRIRYAIGAGRLLVTFLTPQGGEAEYVSALQADGPDKVEPFYDYDFDKESLGQMLRELGSAPRTIDIEMRLQPQNEAYFMEIMSPFKNLRLAQTTRAAEA
ncbi:MAG: hypothetical protein HY517_00900 [Candidatus Aenigmarchaeota archaeon]|nr:hypothetical protein [Candidatus Aenigmarchaeota archaeon]